MQPKEIGAIVSVYTGMLLGDFADTHEYVEKIMGRSVMNAEMGNAEFMAQVKEKAKPDFIKLHVWCGGLLPEEQSRMANGEA